MVTTRSHNNYSSDPLGSGSDETGVRDSSPPENGDLHVRSPYRGDIENSSSHNTCLTKNDIFGLHFTRPKSFVEFHRSQSLVRCDRCEARFQAQTKESVPENAFPNRYCEEDGTILDPRAAANAGPVLSELTPESRIRRPIQTVARDVVSARDAGFQSIQDPAKERAVREGQDGGTGSS